jgi:hypothetical protein
MKGIIYKIACNETGEVYYGSTQQSLNIRISKHKSKCKAWKETNGRDYISSFQIIDRGNYSYSLIETVECEDKRQLEARERFYIENNECINKYIPCRTNKEYREANKENLKEQHKAYYEANKEKIKECSKVFWEQNKDQLQLNRKNSDRDKKYYEANKQKINEKAREKRAKAKELINNN